MSHLRPAFKPIYIPSRVEHPISQIAVIVGGKIIYFEDDEPWPVCPSCSEPLIPYIQLNASSRANPDAFRQLVPPPSNHGRSVTILQLLVCMGSKSLYGTCFQAATTYATTDVSWVLRFIHLSPSQAAVLPTISLEAAESPPAAKTVTEQRKQSYARLEDKFLPVRNITAWTHANEETMHEMINWNWVNDDDAFYEEHMPAEGFKLLGYAVRGKYYCANDECPKGPNPDQTGWRELLQLGSSFDAQEEEEEEVQAEDEEALVQMLTVGNAWIAQCTEHPEVLHLFMSGDW